MGSEMCIRDSNISYQWESDSWFWGGFQLSDEHQNNVWIGTRNILVQIKKNGQAIQEDFPRVILGRGLPAATGGATDYQFPINAMHVTISSGYGQQVKLVFS